MKPYIIVQAGEKVGITLGNGILTISAEAALSMATELLEAGRVATAVESKRRIADLEHALAAAKVEARLAS